MAGHSKWSKVKRIESPLDVKRAAVFSRLVKEVACAVRQGGGDPCGKPCLLPASEIYRAQIYSNFEIPEEASARLTA